MHLYPYPHMAPGIGNDPPSGFANALEWLVIFAVIIAPRRRPLENNAFQARSSSRPRGFNKLLARLVFKAHSSANPNTWSQSSVSTIAQLAHSAWSHVFGEEAATVEAHLGVGGRGGSL